MSFCPIWATFYRVKDNFSLGSDTKGGIDKLLICKELWILGSARTPAKRGMSFCPTLEEELKDGRARPMRWVWIGSCRGRRGRFRLKYKIYCNLRFKMVEFGRFW